MIASPDSAVGVPPTGEKFGYSGHQCSGPLINARLHDILACVQEITLHGVRHGASVALAAVQVETRYELHTMETGFSMGDGPEEHEELIEEFVDVA